MTTGRHSQVFQQLRQTVLARDGAGLTDAELMAHFVGQRDGAALEALIRRHGSMVWSVCRRVLSNEQDAEDAFQASFLVLVRKATSIWPREQVGNWLYGTAYRTALKARTTDARRRAKERRAAEMAHPQAEADAGWSDLLPLLDQELNRLPDKYRTALVLCELEGRSRKEAARQLGIPEGTLSSRLATGRRMLAKRLGRPGLALSAGALATTAAVPPSLMASTVKTSSLVAAGTAAAGVVSVRVAALAEGVVRAMFLSKLSVGAALLVIVGVFAAGAGGVAYRAAAADPKPQPQTPPVAAVQAKGGIVDKEGVKEEEAEWGKAVNGVQVRLRMSKLPGGAAGSRDFTLDVRNHGTQDVGQCRVPNFCEVEWDGQWYTFSGRGDLECKAFALHPGVQIDDWVKASLDTPWERPPEHKAGDPPSIGAVMMRRLQVNLGKHTVRVAFVFNDNTRPVSQLVEYEVGKESAWGEAVDGVQARLRLAKAQWDAGETPTFSLDLRNRGDKSVDTWRAPEFCNIEVDGVWYVYPHDVSQFVNYPLESGKQIDDWVTVVPDKRWLRNARAAPSEPDSLLLPVGKHAIRISLPLVTLAPARGGVPFLVSQPVEIEVGKESAWGEAVEGVQARVRTPKLVWRPKEAPTFSLDLRNQGKKTPDQRRVPVDCQIEVDKVWYSFELPSGPYVSVGFPLKPGEQVNDWTTVTPDDHWTSLTPEKKRFPLPPGKHTIRIAYQLQGTTPAIRPISGPVEIEVEKESEPDKPVGGIQPPAKQAAPGPGLGNKQTAARREVEFRKKLDEPIKYELAVDTTIDKALDELLTRNATPWRVNALAFIKQGQKPDFIKKVGVEKIDPVDGVSRRAVLEIFLSKIESKSEDGQAVAVVRPDGVEITTRRAYLDEFFPGRKCSYLPPLAYAVFDKVPLSAALAELGRTTGRTVILAGYLGKDAETKVTANLTGVPLDTAVVLLADTADLKLVRLGNVYYVTSRERAGLLEKEEQERLLKEEKEKEVPAKPQADKAEPKK